jgi:hypothetical protein
LSEKYKFDNKLDYVSSYGIVWSGQQLNTNSSKSMRNIQVTWRYVEEVLGQETFLFSKEVTL